MTIRIENWSIKATGDPYQPPEVGSKSIAGLVYDHPKFDDGETILTSSIQSHEYENGIVRTMNSTYKLGKIDRGYYSFLKENNIKPKTFNPDDFL